MPALASIQLRNHAAKKLPTWSSASVGSAQEAIPASIKEHYQAFDSLRDRLLLRSNGSAEALRVIAVTSSHRSEGVSTVAAHLAVSLAWQAQGRVLLVDANISDPSVHRIFKAKLSPGLAGLLRNQQENGELIQALPIDNLSILSAGGQAGNLSEIFRTDGFTELLNSLRDEFRYVVIDSPAVAEASSTVQLASLCDGVVLVAEAERVRWEVAERAKERLLESNANILGVVLNKRRFHIPEWLYRTL